LAAEFSTNQGFAEGSLLLPRSYEGTFFEYRSYTQTIAHLPIRSQTSWRSAGTAMELSNIFRLGDCTIRVDAHEVLYGNQVVRVEPKMMAVLVCLARNAGEVVTRQEIFAEVWPGMFVSQDVLTRCIYRLRKVLGGARSKQIETIPTRGYRLNAVVGPVTVKEKRKGGQ
jgi:DNA-binding winged helix-turn-helix (wHTH) protein